jgi:nucleoid-associated protein YgaU
MSRLSDSNLFSRSGYVVLLDDNKTLFFRNPLVWKPQPTDKFHVVRLNESLDAIAYQYYANIRTDAERYWWVIAEANQIQNPLDISDYVGKSIRIPDIKLLDFVER